MKNVLRFTCFIFVFYSCSDKTKKEKNNLTPAVKTLFSKVSSETSGITFQNSFKQDLNLNFLNYPYIYAGAGLAVGDINNDGFTDVYMVSNFGPNKLYENAGNFSFEDITNKSKTEDFIGFSTGATMLDVNNDGWLDIYVSKAGSLEDDEKRRNLLFVNQRDGSFLEEASKWGIDDPGFTTQAYPIDYDKDGDLDLYVVNYRYDFKNNSKISSAIQREIEETTSDQLYRNDGTFFTKVTGAAGLYNKAWGLSAVIADFNDDGWDDIYVANDFLEPDAMYINQQNGTFKNDINNRMNHISFNSMGSDYADLNNDLNQDLITVDMLAENYARGKENMASMSTSNFMSMVNIGYHHAYMANMLQYNYGNGKFKETSQLSGIVKTDWSWAPLIADFNNDGLKDIFISNGILKDYANQDFRNALRAKNANGESMSLDAVSDMIPSEKLNNYIYKNNGDLTFTEAIKEWGIEDPSFSNGAAYADLDNDGDLDLLVNNMDSEIGLYRNNSNQNYVQIKLKGPSKNHLGIGTDVYLKNSDATQLQSLYLTRGFQSSVAPILNFGLGDNDTIDEITVAWPDGKISKIANPEPNGLIEIDYASNVAPDSLEKGYTSYKKAIYPISLAIEYEHLENNFNDYSIQLLLPQKQSTKGTGVVVGDVNNDGLDDFFVGNAAGAHAALYVQNKNGLFDRSNESLWSKERHYEDANALFFDADQDGDQDLYVVSAGYELNENSPLLQDRLYLNNGSGSFTKKNNALPKMLVSGKDITAGDYDNDGDLDLFVGGNVVPGKYPLAPKSFLLNNTKGIFTDDTKNSPFLSGIGMVSKSIFTDYDKDNDLDLLIAGEWMPPTLVINNNGVFEKNDTTTGLENNEGWWFNITAADFDNDGDQDYVVGNIGKNNKFQPTQEKPLYIYADDFDDNGSFDVALSKINEGKQVPVRGKECSSEQNPFLLEKIATYKEFASLDMEHIYGEEKLEDSFQLIAHNFSSSYIENMGDGTFKIKPLPNEAQTGPTMSFITKDFNDDGYLDIMGVGAIYDAEVETIRYDSNYGYVLLGDGKGDFVYSKQYDPFIDSDAKDMTEININGKAHYMVVSNNAPLEIFTFEP